MWDGRVGQCGGEQGDVHRVVFWEGLTGGGTARAGGPLESNWRTKEGCWSVRRNCRNLGGRGGETPVFEWMVGGEAWDLGIDS